MDLEQVAYSSQQMTLQQHIWMKGAADGDYQAMFELICSRTNISAEDALQLVDDEIEEVITKIGAGIQTSIVLRKIGKGLENA